MSIRFKVFTAILAILLLLFIGIRYWPKQTGAVVASNSQNSNIIMGIDGDPRIRLCNNINDADHATPQLIEKLGIKPMTLETKNTANYRVTILRGLEANNYVLEFSTPKGQPPGKIRLTQLKNGQITTESQDLIYEQAIALVESFEKARIWNKERPTLKSAYEHTVASATIEIMAPNIKRCVTTRYDDEHITIIMEQILQRIPAVLTKISLDGFIPPPKTMFGAEVKK